MNGTRTARTKRTETDFKNAFVRIFSLRRPRSIYTEASILLTMVFMRIIIFLLSLMRD